MINDEVTSIDLQERIVKTKNNHEFSYDFLIIALGAEYAPETIPGFAKYAMHIYDLESAIKFRQAIERFREGTIAIRISRIPFKCPAAPYEAALLLDDCYRRKGIRERVSFEFFTPKACRYHRSDRK